MQAGTADVVTLAASYYRGLTFEPAALRAAVIEPLQSDVILLVTHDGDSGAPAAEGVMRQLA